MAATAAAALGCKYAPSPQSGQLLCGSGFSCPEGYACYVDGRCWKSSELPTGSAGADGGAGHGGAGGGTGGTGGTGGNTGLSAMTVVTDASTAGFTGTFQTGSLPATTGSIGGSVPARMGVINGNPLNVNVTSTIAATTVYIGVQGYNGYWQVAVPASTTAAIKLALTPQTPSKQFGLVFVVADSGSVDVSPPVTMLTSVGPADVDVTVTWTPDNDLDLHVIDPNGLDVYYGNPTSPEGGQFQGDSGCPGTAVASLTEETLWPPGTALSGTYTVAVNNFSVCRTTPSSYTVQVNVTGQPSQTFTGMFTSTDPTGTSATPTTVGTFTFP